MRSMKTVGLFLWGVVWFCCVPADAAVAGNAPDIHVAESVLDLGTVLEGQPVQGIFTVINNGDLPLTLKNVGRSSGCIVERFPHQVAPGQAGKIEVGLATRNRSGKIEGGFFVHSDDPDTPRLVLRATAMVTPLISVEPDRVYFSGFADGLYQTTITIQSNAPRPLALKPVISSVGDVIRHRMTVDKKGHAYRLAVSLQPQPGDCFRGRLTIATNYPERPEIVIPVLGRIMDDVEVMPPVLDFGLRLKKDYMAPPPDATVRLKDWQENLRRLPGNVFLRVNRGADLRLTDVRLESPFFTLEREALDAGRLYKVTVCPKIDRMPPGGYAERLTVSTDRPGYQIFEVPIELTVK